LNAEGGDLFAVLRRSGQLRSLNKGQPLFDAGESADAVFLVVSGTVRSCMMLPDGRRQIVSFHEADELIGITAAKHYLYSAEAVTKVEARTVSRLWLDGLLHLQPRLCLSLIPRTARHLETAQRHIALVGRMTARARLCSFLLERLRGRAVLIELPMSRTDIADYLGLSIETVSRTMTQLRAEGLIRTPSANTIEVVDSGRLEGVIQDPQDEPGAKRLRHKNS
jgi:CRP-like cAMP-binding protein